MFSIGLEFSLPRLFAMKRIVFGLGLLQVVVTAGAIAAAAVALAGVPWLAGLALGGSLAMSSTAILSKLLAERLELDSAHGREVMGVLLFQDLAVVPMLVLIPAFSQPVERLAGAVVLAGIKAAMVLILILFFGQKPMRAWLGLVARRKSGELFVLNVLLVTLGLAWVTQLAGLSLALGAFVAGMLISETEYRYQVEDDIKAFRDVLLGLFFISIGMLLDIPAVAHEWPRVLGVLAALLAGKLAVAWALSRLFRTSPGNALRTGLWLCAGGEFGFVLLAHGESVGLLPEGPLQPVLAALVLSLMLAPLIVHFSDRLVLRLVSSEWLLRSMQLTQIAAHAMATEKHAILCGYGRTGQHLARFLEKENVSYVALDLDPDRVQEAADAGEPVVYGDCSRRETLLAAGLNRASLVVVTFADVGLGLRTLARVHELRPDMPVVVRAREQEEADRLLAAGAAEAVPEALESSVMLATHALALLGVPMHRIVKGLRQLREQHYGLLRGFFHGATDAGDRLAEADQPRLHRVVLTEESHAVGKSVGQTRLAETGVAISTIRRRGRRHFSPPAEMVMECGDVVVLQGSAAAVKAGEARLLKGK